MISTVRPIRLPALASLLIALGCGSSSDSPQADAGILTTEERALASTLSPLPAVPPDTTNRYADDAKAAAFGQRLFFDRRFSGALAVTGDLGQMGETGKIACASCHAGKALDDRRSLSANVSLGADFLPRNSLPLVNSSFYRWTNWAGRFSAQWELPPAVLENGRNMNGNRLQLAHAMFDRYRQDYEAVFGPLDPAIGSDAARFPAAGKPKAANAADGMWEMMAAADRDKVTRILVNFGKALQAYTRKLVSRNSRLDRFVAGETTALTAGETRGLKLFVGKAACVSCHAGAHLSDGEFHNIGLAQTGMNVPAMDNGRFADMPALLGSAIHSGTAFSDDPTVGRLAGLSNPAPEMTMGQFRTASLRNIADSAPYMHAGQFKTLEEVVDYYDRGGTTPATGTKDALMKALGLTAEEKADLVAFLKSLSGDDIPGVLLQDTSAP